FRAPLLDWFRGLKATLIKYDDRLSLHAEVDMQRKPGELKIELPLFNNLFGGGANKAPANKAPADNPSPEKKPDATDGAKEKLPPPPPVPAQPNGTAPPKKVREI